MPFHYHFLRLQVCLSTVTVRGGSVLFQYGAGKFENALPGGGLTGNNKIVVPGDPALIWTCPSGSYWDAELVCPIW